jgi:hypothetical protein
MRKRSWRGAALALGLSLVTVPLRAHHEFPSEYDDKKPITLKGVVTRFEWSHPHAFVDLDVPDAAGNITSWSTEFADPLDLKRAGWTRTAVQVGETVTVEGILARDGSKLAAGKTLILAGGKRLTEPTEAQLAGPRARPAAKPTPRWPDGHPRIGAAPGETGFWAYATPSALVENNANIRMDSQGLLLNLADADKVAPFQPWAKGLYIYRQRSLLKDDPMASCLPPGGPRQFEAPYGLTLLEQPDRQRIFAMSAGGNRNWRLIYLDGRELPSGDDVSPTYFGYSTGKWEGDTLVLHTGIFNERFWFSNGGLPHTENLKLTERISRPDFNTLKYEVTVDDTGAYTRPWKSSLTLEWVAGEEMPEYFCQDNNRDPEHMVGR